MYTLCRHYGQNSICVFLPVINRVCGSLWKVPLTRLALTVTEKHKNTQNMNFFKHVKFFENDLPKPLWGTPTVFSNTALFSLTKIENSAVFNNYPLTRIKSVLKNMLNQRL